MSEIPSHKLAYSVADAADLCGVSETTMREMIRCGRIYAVAFGAEGRRGELRVGRAELERFLLGLPTPERGTK